MSVFDIIVFTILLALILRGIWTGMISQIVSVGAYFVGWIIASRFAFLVAPSIPAEEPWNQVGAMAVLFVAVMIAIRFFHAVLESFVKRLHLDGLNKLLGGVLGGLKAVLVCTVLTFFAVMWSETSQNIVFQSKTGSFFVDVITKTSAFVPKDSYELLQQQLDKFNTKTAQRPVTPEAAAQNIVSSDAAPVSTGSLMTAIGKWWSGTKAVVTENVTKNLTQELAQNLPVSEETLKNVFQSVSSAVVLNTPAELPQISVIAAPKPNIDDLFLARQSGIPQDIPVYSEPVVSASTNTMKPLGQLLPLEPVPMPDGNVPMITSEQILDTSPVPPNFNPGNAGAVRWQRSSE
jgi:membrane protein required for colicin V production